MPEKNKIRKYYPLTREEHKIDDELRSLVEQGKLSLDEAFLEYDNIIEQKKLEAYKAGTSYDALSNVPSKEQIIAQQRKEYSQDKIAELEAADAKQPWWNKHIMLGTPDMSGAKTIDLKRMQNEAADAEVAERRRIKDMTFLEALTDDGARSRMLKSALKSPAQAVDGLTIALPGLLAKGAEYVTGADLGSKEILQEYMEQHERNNIVSGVSDPENLNESVAESVVGAIIPGGLATKATGMGADFLVDQTVRELTDKKSDDFETIYDKLGVTNDTETPTLGLVPALGVGMLTGSLTISAVSKLSKATVKSPTMRLITELDPEAPKGLQTLEKASDLTKTNIIDEQKALIDILGRHGVGNIDELNARINFETHSGAQTRIKEALATGRLETYDKVFEVAVPPKVLHGAYQQLPKELKKNVHDYIVAKDLLDDLHIAKSQGKDVGEKLGKLKQFVHNLGENVPETKYFSEHYNNITKGLRDFGEGSIFSPEFRKQLDKTRRNYVPYEVSSVDRSAPFLQRMKQAQKGEGSFDNQWFLQTRTPKTTIDLDRKIDPMDMMLQASEATLTARMKNDTKISIVDSILAGPTGDKTIRKASAEEVSKHPSRVISVYRNGEKEDYITTKLTAALVKFDPYVAKYPKMFAVKRTFEQTAVGPLSLVFAPVTAIRDTIGGKVTRSAGTIPPSILGTASAIPEQLWAKSLKAAHLSLEQNFLKNGGDYGIVPTPLANYVAHSYNNTLYHQSNLYGGFDSSLMKERISSGKSALSEVARTATQVADDLNIPGTRLVGRQLKNMIKGFDGIFGAIQDAPRYSAIKRTHESGKDLQSSVKLAREITGDVSKSGRVFDAQGNRLDVDAVDQGALNFANKYIGEGTGLIRENVPFVNPMIQGNRQLLKSVIEDPIGFNIRAWATIGIPATVAFGWNEMLGEDYNTYAMERRSGKDVAMQMYFGIPGLPPEKGIEIPLPHELLMFSAPFTRSLYGISRGEENRHTRAALGVVAQKILQNSLDIGTPVVGNAMFNISGYAAPSSLINPKQGVYKIREDDLGALPENIEQLSKTLFASVGETAIQMANAVAGDMSMEEFYETMANKTMARTPILKNVLGKKKANVHFSVPKEIAANKMKALRKFKEYYNASISPKRINEDGFRKPASKNYYTSMKNAGPYLKQKTDLPFLNIGPSTQAEIKNPIVLEFAEDIMDKTFRGTVGMTAMMDRERTYSKFASQLKKYNQGHKKALDKWQNILVGKRSFKNDNTAALRRIFDENNIDLTKYDDRVRLINIVESHREDIIQGQLTILRSVEDQITKVLQERKQIPEGKTFMFDRHLDPIKANPFVE